MRVYVAGKFTTPEETRAVQAACHTAGHAITYDWTTNHIPTSTGIHDRRRLRREYAIADLNGVREADVVLALFTDPTYAYRGTFTEIGFALAQGKRVLAVCPHYKGEGLEPAYATNCFFEAPGVLHIPTVEAALAMMQIASA